MKLLATLTQAICLGLLLLMGFIQISQLNDLQYGHTCKTGLREADVVKSLPGLAIKGE